MENGWHYAREGQQLGPVPLDELRRLAAVGTVRPDTLVWTESMPAWRPYADVFAATTNASPTLAYAGGNDGPPIFSPRALTLLRQTRPWVRIISVMLFVLAGFMFVIGLIATLVLGVASSRRGGAGPVPRLSPLFGTIYMAFALLYIVPGIYLWRYASYVRRLDTKLGTDMIEQALAAQKSFWKYVGIVVLAVIGLYLVGIVVAGAVAASR